MSIPHIIYPAFYMLALSSQLDYELFKNSILEPYNGTIKRLKEGLQFSPSSYEEPAPGRVKQCIKPHIFPLQLLTTQASGHETNICEQSHFYKLVLKANTYLQ